MAHESLDWLPDRHLGVAATLAHVDEVVQQLCEVLFPYQAQPDGIVEFREVLDGAVSRTVVARIAPIPRKVPLLVADALVGLRGALEHVLFAEVVYLDGPIEGKAATQVEMPAAQSRNKFDEWLKKRGKNAPGSLRAGSPLVKRIEGLQPFQRRKDPGNHPLAVLTAHTNHVKHRMPAVTAVSLPVTYMHDEPPRSPKNLPRRPERPLQVGEVIAETPLGVQRTGSAFAAVGINRPGTDQWPFLMTEVRYLSDWVRQQALPRLITGVEPPSPPLPTRYDIRSGHDDERAAIASGETVSAAQKYSDRLSAHVARNHMVETVSQMPGAPPREQIAAWCGALPDVEAIERASQIQQLRTDEPGILLHNLKVLERMRGDAKRFAEEAERA